MRKFKIQILFHIGLCYNCERSTDLCLQRRVDLQVQALPLIPPKMVPE